MGIFDKPEVVVLKESSDAKLYLAKLEELVKEVPEKTDLAQRIEKEIAITKAGIIGEDQIMFELKNSGMDLIVLHDIYIEDTQGNGAQIDYFVITPYVNVFIECKNLFGNIEINNRGDFVRTIQFGNKFFKEGIYSPITQNERHMRVFKDARRSLKGFILGALYEMQFDEYNKSLVVLANHKTVVNDRYAPAGIKKQVIRVDHLINTLKGFKTDAKSGKKEMLKLGEKILAMNIEERKDYFAKFEEWKKELENSNGSASDESDGLKIEKEKSAMAEEEKSTMVEEEESVAEVKIENATQEKMICPKCGSTMVLRTAKKGENAGKQFYGCSAFPRCRYIKDLE